MAFLYTQREGWLGWGGVRIASGYSGRDTETHKGLNNPDYQGYVDIGPIPAGLWHMQQPFDSDVHGPFCIPLVPDTPMQLRGRSGFLVHGDNKKGDHSASHGCIIVPHYARHKLWDSMDHQIQVVESLKDEESVWPYA